MKILLLTQLFEPEPTFKGLVFAKALQAKGHKVEVLTGFPNYPGGKVYSGYKISWYKKEILDGIVIHRAPLYPSHDSSALKRILNYTSFGLSSAIIGLINTRDIDVIYSYHPPLTTSISALILSYFKNIPFVVDIQDLWPDTLSATGMLTNKSILRIIAKICELLYKKADKIIVLSPGFKKLLVSRGVPSNKIEIIYNWCNESALKNYEKSDVILPDNDNLNLVFAGNLGYAQGLPAIVETSRILQENCINVNIVLLGDGVAKQEAVEMGMKQNLNNLFFLPRVPMSQVGGILSQADMLLVHLNDNELFRITIPSRTQTNLAIGKPIIMGVQGDAADLVNASGAGVVCPPNSPEKLANAIKSLASKTSDERLNIGNKGKNFYYRELSLEKGVSKFCDIFQELE